MLYVSLVAYANGALRINGLKRMVVDTTVQPKAVTHPTEAKLRYRPIVKLGEAGNLLSKDQR